MTDYELMELSASRADEVARAFRFWVTINFAVVAAAYAAGNLLSVWTVALILGLYLFITYTNDRVMRQGGMIQKGLLDEMIRQAQPPEAPGPALKAMIDTHEQARRTLPAMIALRVNLFLSFQGRER